MLNGKLARYARLARNPVALLKARQYILILSHMRARTTLLSHVLGSHPDICGYKELHCTYETPVDFLRAKAALMDEDRYASADFLLDKLLHNRLQVNLSLFGTRQLLPIFVLREPRGSIASMMQMHNKINKSTYFDHLYEYYNERLSGLTNHARAMGRRAVFLDSDAIVRTPDHMLENLTRFLGLSQPLTKAYKMFSGTGQAGLGDPGEHIRAGVILPQTSRHQAREIPEEVIDRAERSYQRALEVFRQECRQIVDD